MPELPEVEILCRRLNERVEGRRVDRLEVASLSALKTFDPPLLSFEGRQIAQVCRRGKFVCIDLTGRWLVVNLARSGWIKWRTSFGQKSPKLGRGPLALRVRLGDGSGFDVTEMSTEKRLAVYTAHELGDIEAVASLGPEPLGDSFSREALADLRNQPGDIKHVLSRQSLIAGIGNAYSDEVLHAARLSPFKPAANLTDIEVDALYSVVVSVLGDAIKRASRLDLDELKDGKRAGMAVHARTGLPCPACGDTIQEVSFSSRSLQYCPTCQTGGRRLADRRLSRLLK